MRRALGTRSGCGDAAAAFAAPLARLAVIAVASTALVWQIAKPKISEEAVWDELARAAETRVSPAVAAAIAQQHPALYRRRLAEDSSEGIAWSHIVSGDETAFLEGTLATPSPRVRSSLHALPARFARLPCPPPI